VTERKLIYAGTAEGGPADGQELESRRKGGVLLVSSGNAGEERRCWVYDFDQVTGRFVVREPEGRRFDADRHDEKIQEGLLDYEPRAAEDFQ